MAGFSGSTGVSKKYVDDAIQQSTALKRVGSIDITGTTNASGIIPITALSNYVAAYDKFISAFVIGMNYNTVDIYTYNNLVYGRVRNYEDISIPLANTSVTIRVRYIL